MCADREFKTGERILIRQAEDDGWWYRDGIVEEVTKTHLKVSFGYLNHWVSLTNVVQLLPEQPGFLDRLCYAFTGRF